MSRVDMLRRAAEWAAVAAVVGSIGVAGLSAAQRYPKPDSTTALNGAAIAAALAKLEAQQEEIVRRLESVKKEAEIVKVRAATIPSGICN